MLYHLDNFFLHILRVPKYLRWQVSSFKNILKPLNIYNTSTYCKNINNVYFNKIGNTQYVIIIFTIKAYILCKYRNLYTKIYQKD